MHARARASEAAPWSLGPIPRCGSPGGRKLILPPDGADGLDAEPPRPDGTALRALARAWRWHRLLEEGRYGSIKALARAEGVHHAYVAKLLRLTVLAPDLVEAALDGRLRKGLKLEAPIVRRRGKDGGGA